MLTARFLLRSAESSASRRSTDGPLVAGQALLTRPGASHVRCRPRNDQGTFKAAEKSSSDLRFANGLKVPEAAPEALQRAGSAHGRRLLSRKGCGRRNGHPANRLRLPDFGDLVSHFIFRSVSPAPAPAPERAAARFRDGRSPRCRGTQVKRFPEGGPDGGPEDGVVSVKFDRGDTRP